MSTCVVPPRSGCRPVPAPPVGASLRAQRPGVSRFSLPEPRLLTRDVPEPGRRGRPCSTAVKPPPCPRAARATVPPAEGASLRPSGVLRAGPCGRHGPCPAAERRPLSRDTVLLAATPSQCSPAAVSSRLPPGPSAIPAALPPESAFPALSLFVAALSRLSCRQPGDRVPMPGNAADH